MERNRSSLEHRSLVGDRSRSARIARRADGDRRFARIAGLDSLAAKTHARLGLLIIHDATAGPFYQFATNADAVGIINHALRQGDRRAGLLKSAELRGRYRS